MHRNIEISKETLDRIKLAKKYIEGNTTLRQGDTPKSSKRRSEIPKIGGKLSLQWKSKILTKNTKSISPTPSANNKPSTKESKEKKILSPIINCSVLLGGVHSVKLDWLRIFQQVTIL